MDSQSTDPRLPRGIRNRNPGNVRATAAFQWLGQIGQDADNFVINRAPEYGLREIMILFHNYQEYHQLHTTYQLIRRWAPPNENDPADYARFVAGRVMVGINDPIDITVVWRRWTSAIVMYENGQDPYNLDLYTLAHAMAFNTR